MRVRRPFALVAGLALAACNLVTGVTDLQVGSESDTTPIDGGVRDGAVDHASPVTADDSGKALDAAVDAPVDAPAGCVSTPAPTTLLGVAANTGVAGYYQLTPETNALAGGVATATPSSLDDFDASFSYSITYSSGTNVGAGLAFFVIAAPAKTLACQSGPSLCTLGGNVPGFAVVLRTSKLAAGDPEVPYLAVVDAAMFPDVLPANPLRIDPTKAYAIASSPPGGGLPGPNTFHTMSIAVRAGKATVSIDGAKLLNGVPIPGWAAGRSVTWGIGSATGQGPTFAERTFVGQISVSRCTGP